MALRFLADHCISSTIANPGKDKTRSSFMEFSARLASRRRCVVCRAEFGLVLTENISSFRWNPEFTSLTGVP
jgi:hypothetical protein